MSNEGPDRTSPNWYGIFCSTFDEKSLERQARRTWLRSSPSENTILMKCNVIWTRIVRLYIFGNVMPVTQGDCRYFLFYFCSFGAIVIYIQFNGNEHFIPTKFSTTANDIPSIHWYVSILKSNPPFFFLTATKLVPLSRTEAILNDVYHHHADFAYEIIQIFKIGRDERRTWVQRLNTSAPNSNTFFFHMLNGNRCGCRCITLFEHLVVPWSGTLSLFSCPNPSECKTWVMTVF